MVNRIIVRIVLVEFNDPISLIFSGVEMVGGSVFPINRLRPGLYGYWWFDGIWPGETLLLVLGLGF